MQETSSPARRAELWINTADARDKIVAPPLQVDDQVFVGTADNHILALNAADGSLLWDYETDHAIWGQPAYRDGVLYVASMDWSVYALDAASGELVWRTELGGALPSSPVLGDDLLYVSSFDGNVHALDLATGKERWAASGAGDWVWGAPALADGTLYFSDIAGNLFAVDAQTGEQHLDEATEAAHPDQPGRRRRYALRRLGDRRRNADRRADGLFHQRRPAAVVGAHLDAALHHAGGGR